MKLNSGHEMPIMALGTWLHKYDFENQMADAVVYAINKGYRIIFHRFLRFFSRFYVENQERHIDCAYIYLNEAEIGGAFARTIGKSGFSQSKLISMHILKPFFALQ